MKFYNLLFFLLFLLSSFELTAQHLLLLEIKSSGTNSTVKVPDYKKTFTTKLERSKELQRVLFSFYDNAYLGAAFDSLIMDSTHLVAFFHPGELYKWTLLKRGNVDEGILSEIGFRESLYENKPFYFKDVLKMQEKILVYCENNGYPYASIKLDSIQFFKNTMLAKLNLTKNVELHIDSITVEGSANIAPVYLYNYLNIHPGSLYNESAINKINIRLKEIPFLTQKSVSTIVFLDKYNKLILYLENKKASQFDGIVGLLTDNATNKIILTGDVRLKIQNTLGHGELIDINWRRLLANTQDLNAKFIYPFLFSSPFGIDYNFKLYKKDTLFIDLNQNLGIQYLLNGGSYFKVFVNAKQSNLLSTKGIEFQTTLPPYADISSILYGLGYKAEHLDYRLNPRKGFTLNIIASAGNKNIKKNARLNPIIYNNVKINSAQYISNLEFSIYLPLRDRSAIKISCQNAYLLGSSTFQNELFRIGGLKTLRGFDEESINASVYSILTFEYRYLLEQNSYLYLFFDGAYYENKNITTPFIHDTPYGFGSGISFQTKAGIFSVNYAIGKQFDNPIDFKSGKIHFGIVNYF